MTLFLNLISAISSFFPLLFFNQWDQKMEDKFKTEVARAATEYCVKSESKCQSPPLR